MRRPVLLPFLAALLAAATRWLQEQGFPYTYTVTDGAHDWIVWRRYLAEFLPRLFTNQLRGSASGYPGAARLPEWRGWRQPSAGARIAV